MSRPVEKRVYVEPGYPATINPGVRLQIQEGISPPTPADPYPAEMDQRSALRGNHHSLASAAKCSSCGIPTGRTTCLAGKVSCTA